MPRSSGYRALQRIRPRACIWETLVPVLADVLTSAASWQDERPLLTYLVPGKLQAELCAGQLVAIPYGDRLVEGIVWVIRQEQDGQDGHDGYAENDKALRPIHTILDLEPVLLPHQCK